VDRAKIHTGHTVLIQAGAGASVIFAVQLARLSGQKYSPRVAGEKASRGEISEPSDRLSRRLSRGIRSAHTEGKGFDIVYDTGWRGKSGRFVYGG